MLQDRSQGSQRWSQEVFRRTSRRFKKILGGSESINGVKGKSVVVSGAFLKDFQAFQWVGISRG